MARWNLLVSSVNLLDMGGSGWLSCWSRGTKLSVMANESIVGPNPKGLHCHPTSNSSPQGERWRSVIARNRTRGERADIVPTVCVQCTILRWSCWTQFMTNVNVKSERISSDLKHAGCIMSVLFQDDSD